MSNAASDSEQIELGALDALDLPFLYVDSKGSARFLSSRAAQLLGLRERRDFSQNLALLQPLLDLAAKNSVTGSVSLRRAQSMSQNVAELLLYAADKHCFNALAFTKPLSVVGRAPLAPVDGIQPSSLSPSAEAAAKAGTAVIFHDLSIFEPFFHTIEQSRRNRAVLVLGSSLFGRSLLYTSSGSDTVSVYQAIEENFFKNHPSQHENVMQTDLLRGLSIAVDIVDPLLLPSAKLLLDVKTSVLLRISLPNFLRIVSHMILEASDFVGPFGICKLRASVEQDTNVPGGGHRVSITVSAERKAAIPYEATPLELYIYRRFMPLYYKVTVAELQSSAETPKEGTTGNVNLADEQLSENINICQQIARQCNVPLEIIHPQQDILLLSAKFVLATESM